MSKTNEFIVIPVKFSSRVPVGSFHEVYAKLDQSSANERPQTFKGRTLFVTNIPPWMGKDEIGTLFHPFKIEHIVIQKEARAQGDLSDDELKQYAGYRVAYVAFENKADAAEVLSRKHNREVSIYQDRGTELVGMRKMVEAYTQEYRPREELEATISEVVALYDKKVEDEKQAAMKLQEPDDEGWITVTKHGKRPFIPRAEAVQARLLEKERMKDQRKQKANFYAFQAKRSKLNDLEEMRRKFGEDKRRVALMKIKRKFNPL